MFEVEGLSIATVDNRVSVVKTFTENLAKLSDGVARVRELLMFHHDPDRSDDELDAMQEEGKKLLGDELTCTVAHEELVLKL